MKAKNELFELVKSLSKTEKRYIRLYSSRHSNGTIYNSMFNALEKFNGANESEFKKRNKHQKFMKHYQFNKHYLYGLIIKLLADYNHENSVDAKIHTMIMQCKILFDKALYRQYFKSIEKAKKFALKHEKYGYFLQILDMERIIIKKEEVQTLKSESIYSEAMSSIEHLKNSFELSRLSSSLLLTYREYGVTRDEKSDTSINKTLEHPIMRSQPDSLSSRERETYYRIQEIINEIKGNYAGVYEALENRLKIIQNDPFPFKNYILNYGHDVLSSLIYTSLKMNNFDDAERYLEEYTQSEKNNESEAVDFEILSTQAAFLIAMKKGSYSKASELIPGLERILVKFRNKILIDTELLIRFQFVKYYILVSDFSEALKYSNILSAHPLLNKRADIESYLKILNLIIHFELGNLDLLKYLLVSTYRFLYKKKKLYRLELLIMEFIRRLPKITTEDDLIFSFGKLKKQLELLKNDDYEKNAFEYFNFLEWITNKTKA